MNSSVIDMLVIQLVGFGQLIFFSFKQRLVKSDTNLAEVEDKEAGIQGSWADGNRSICTVTAVHAAVRLHSLSFLSHHRYTHLS